MVGPPRSPLDESIVSLRLALEATPQGVFRRLVHLLVLLDEEGLNRIAQAVLAELRREDQARLDALRGPGLQAAIDHGHESAAFDRRWREP